LREEKKHPSIGIDVENFILSFPKLPATESDTLRPEHLRLAKVVVCVGVF